MKPITKDAFQLLNEGALALARAQHEGIRIDVAYLHETHKKVTEEIKTLTQKLMQDEVWNVWRKVYGDSSNLSSRPQLADIIFNRLKYPCLYRTEKNREATTPKAFKHVGLPFVKDYFRLAKLQKVKSTYLEGIMKEVCDGYLHPMFNLHTTVSFRSSSSLINFQNQPVRDKELGPLIRKIFIPRPGRRLVEVDFAAVEVRVAYCCHLDPAMRTYLLDSNTDMHRDTAADLFMLPRDQIQKRPTRDWAKNRFVFPEFYGSVFFQCAAHIWEGIEEEKDYVLPNGKRLVDHLKDKGIKTLGSCDPKRKPEPGTFEYHVKEVERIFWEERFPVFTKWKERLYRNYCETGRVELATGFVCEGIYRKNQVLNLPIQGCLVGDTRVLTDSGHIPIKELVGVPTKVWTGFRWADAVGLDRGESQRVNVHLSSGITIQCDARHKFKNQKEEWVTIDELEVGDWVALPKVDEELTPTENMNWWFVFGFIIGDGCLHSRKTNTTTREYLSICVGAKKKTILDEIHSFLLKEGYRNEGYGSVRRRIRPAIGNKKEKYELTVEIKQFVAFLKQNGFDFSWKSKTKRIPESVWRATKQQQRDFMEGLWMSDGSRGYSQDKYLHMANLPLLKEVQILIAGLGFDSVLWKSPTGHLLRVYQRKQGGRPQRKYPIEAITNYVTKVNRKNYTSEAEYVVDHRAFAHETEIGQYIAERILAKNGNAPLVYRFDKVVEVEWLDEVETTYTMSVDDPLHQFVAGGVIHKNTAFHCDLWSFVDIHKEIKKRKMRTRLIGQIHDSILADVPESEVQDYLHLAHEVTSERLPKHWDWIVIPLETESEVCDADWSTKKEWKNYDGIWKEAKK